MIEAKEPTLTVLYEGSPIFTSHGKWLHPLFELEAYLAEYPIQPENLLLQDKIIGKAAALMIHRLGFRTVKAGILSRLGEAVLQRVFPTHFGERRALSEGYSHSCHIL